jgi:hypothetical protein
MCVYVCTHTLTDPKVEKHTDMMTIRSWDSTH